MATKFSAGSECRMFAAGSLAATIIKPANDHEQFIAHAVDEEFLEDPSDSRHLIIRDVAMSLNFVMSASDSEFLVSYFKWRFDHPVRPMAATTSDDPYFTVPSCEFEQATEGLQSRRFRLRRMSLHCNAHGRYISRPSRSLGHPRRFRVDDPIHTETVAMLGQGPRVAIGLVERKPSSGQKNGRGSARGVERPFLRESIHRLRLLCRFFIADGKCWTWWPPPYAAAWKRENIYKHT
jgi:hypothetical protein